MTDTREALKYLGLALLVLVWFLSIFISLLFPCISFPGEQGESIALSRLEHAWVVFAHPEWIWEQWTAGTSRIQLTDRLPSLCWALLCISIYTATGFAIGRSCNLRTHSASDSISAWLFSFLIGYCWCGTWISLLSWILDESPILATGMGMVISLVIPWGLGRMIAAPHSTEAQNQVALRWDDVSWKRRLTGLFFVGSGILFLVQSIGSLVPSMDEEVRRGRWSSKLTDSIELKEMEQLNFDKSLYWSALEDVRSAWWHIMPSGEEDSDLQKKVHQLVLRRYELLIASKWIASIAWIASLIVLAGKLNSLHGSLVAMLTTFFFAASSSWTELIRLGRPEVISGAASVGILCVWMDSVGSRSLLNSRGRWITTVLLSGPIVIGLASSLQLHGDVGYQWSEAVLRLAGFSSLYSLPWAATCFFGCLVACTTQNASWRWVCGSASLTLLAFAILGGGLAQPDRVWLPFGSLLVLSFAFGIERILKLRGGWGWLFFWGFAGGVSLLNNTAQPGWDNRIFGDLKGSVFAQPTSEEQAFAFGAFPYRFADEIQAKTIEGVVRLEDRLLLLGHWDCLDIPQRTSIHRVGADRIVQLSKEAMRDQGITHIALVDSSERGFVEWDDSLEQDYRIHLAKLEEQGVVTKLPVSERSRDLTLFQVNP